MLLELIKQKLSQSFPNAIIEIFDNSKHHEEHRGHGAHIVVRIAWEGFKNVSLVEQHKLVYKTLEKEFKEKIHSLQIKTREI